MNDLNLTQKRCVPCEGGACPLKVMDTQGYLAQLKTEWEIVEGKKIKKQFKFKNFVETMKFVNKVADIAEDEGHHPDIYIFYNKVTIELWTHAIDGLSENDFIVASKIELLI